MCEAEVCAGIDTEFRTDPFIRWNIIFIVFLIKCGVFWQGAHALDPAHLE